MCLSCFTSLSEAEMGGQTDRDLDSELDKSRDCLLMHLFRSLPDYLYIGIEWQSM